MRARPVRTPHPALRGQGLWGEEEVSLHSEPHRHTCKVDQREIVSCGLLITGGDGSKALKLVEEDLHEITFLVETPVVSSALFSRGMGTDDRLHSVTLNKLDDLI